MNLRDEYVMAIEAENDLLREKVASLEEMLGLRIEAPMVLRLTSQEAKLFGLLLKRELVTKEMAMSVLYGERPNGEAEIKIVDVYICKARKKLTPFDIQIETVWGRGYRMPAPSKAVAVAMLEQARAA